MNKNPMPAFHSWWLIIVFIVLILSVHNTTPDQTRRMAFSEFIDAVESGKVNQVTITDRTISGVLKDQTSFTTYAPPEYPALVKLLRSHDVSFSAHSTEPGILQTILVQWGPLFLILGVWLWFSARQYRQMGSGGGIFSFGKNRARMQANTTPATFNDVAGVDEAKEELKEIIDFLKDPLRFSKLGGRIPKGVLLVGPPGTGKTLLARAVAGEAAVPFFFISGSDFVEMFVGVGASRVRNLFIDASKQAPCIIFIDEIDAIGRHRNGASIGGHDEREQTLNQLLVEMDGFSANVGVIIIAATNRPDVLDPALLRPGRFDRRVVVPRPDIKGREMILRVHVKSVPMSEDVDLSVIARGTPGFVGADLRSLVNEAALLAARTGKEKVSMAEFEASKDKVLMGAERRSMILSLEERRTIAYHESGHALVAKLLPGADPIHKVTIIPRGMALGLTQQLPTEEKNLHTKDFLEKRIAILFGGRIAEEMMLGAASTGASDDLEKATDLARRMVCEWGMSDKLGHITFGKKQKQSFLGSEIAMGEDYSPETAREIDQEVRRIAEGGYVQARALLEANKDILELIARTLLERETLDGSDIEILMNI